MPDVRLVDLEVIKRFSLAVRQEFADAREVLEALEADRAALERSLKPAAAKKGRSTGRGRATAAKKTASKKTASKKPATKSAARKKTASKKTAGKKATAKKPARRTAR